MTSPHSDSKKSLGITALILGAMAIALAPILLRFSETGPTATAFWRMLLPLPLTGLLVLKNHKAQQVAAKPLLGLILLTGIFFATDLALWHRALLLTSVANATLESNLGVIFVPILCWLLFKERISMRFCFALILALFGTILLVGKNAQFSANTLKGDALGVLSGVFYSGYIIAIKMIRDRGMSTLRLMFLSGVTSSIFLFILSHLQNETFWPVTTQGWWILIAIAFFTQFLGQSLIAYAMASLPASMTALGLLIQPLTAAFIAWGLFQEHLSPWQMIGAIAIFVGIWIAKSQSPRKTKSQ